MHFITLRSAKDSTQVTIPVNSIALIEGAEVQPNGPTTIYVAGGYIQEVKETMDQVHELLRACGAAGLPSSIASYRDLKVKSGG